MGSASLRADFDFWAGIKAGFQTLQSHPAGLFTGSHLWILYHLSMMTALALVLRGKLAQTGLWSEALMRRADRFAVWLANSSFSLPVLSRRWRSLIGYDLFVRLTFVGGVLNDRRRDRALVDFFRNGSAGREAGNS